ncbi:MAG: N-acetylmuramoyl-L-alanine amidase [Bradyrhizobiaceae bacterium]|nr:N-acetylmuramoyl-L-alanine amidase [Bradyrhizobiaceae bacterium]
MGKVVCLAIMVVFGTICGTAQITVQSVSCTQSADTLELLIEADAAIQNFQKPEVAKHTVVFRIVGAVMSDKIALPTSPSATIGYEQIREYLVLRVRAPSIAGASVKRLSATTLSLKVYPVASTKTKTSARTGKPATGNEWSLDVIVLDAGHGGKDVGAKGVNGVYEKDVTLSIARKLRALIEEAFPSTKVVMTRDSDTFVELYRRTQIANEAKGKLFISIHCNSMPTIPHPAGGCETYILRPGRNEDAARVAELENASVKLEGSTNKYDGLDADQLIVATMAQRSFVRFSEELARKIQRHASSSTGLANRGVNQAGFFVLVGASMPNVLFETAFLSNREDAEYISSTKGQQTMAKAILSAIKEYADVYQESLK